MKVLYVGGIWPCELSLLKESQHNPNVKVNFVSNTGHMRDVVLAGVLPGVINAKSDIDRIKTEYNPDITVFRNFSGMENWLTITDYLWNQEIDVKSYDGYFSGSYTEDNIPVISGKLAFQSKPRAIKHNGYWFPYCVSKYWGSNNFENRKGIILATSVPCGVNNKVSNINMMIEGIPYKYRMDLFCYCGYNGGLESIPIVIPYLKPSYHPLEVDKILSNTYIYLSPSSIWFEEGCVSYKTVEAMAFGCLTFTYNYIGMEDVFGKDGDTIIYVNSKEEMEEKVTYYMENKDKGIEVAKRGYDFIHENYGWEKHLTRLIEDRKI